MDHKAFFIKSINFTYFQMILPDFCFSLDIIEHTS